MIVRNMPGVVTAGDPTMYNQAEKDGTVIATVNNNSIPLHQVLDGKGVRFDGRGLLARLHRDQQPDDGGVAHVRLQDLDDVMARELVAGATGIGSGTFIYPTPNVVLGTNSRFVMGYKSSSGRCG